MPAEPAIELRGVTVEYRERWRRPLTAVRDLSLTVRPGEIYGFLGPNGAGKTTAIHCLLGLLRPTRGEALLLGRPVGNPEVFRRVGYMPEDWTGWDFLTLHEMLAGVYDLYGLPAKQRGDRVREVAEKVGLSGHLRRRHRRLSKGMRQRASLAQTLLPRPEILVLDEPTKELDPIGRRDVRELLRELAAGGTTILLSSHLLSEVESVCDRVGILNDGRLVAEAPLPAILTGRDERVIRFTRPDGAPVPVGTTVGPEGECRLNVAAAGDLYEAMNALRAHGAVIISVQSETLRLEDYFIQVIRQGPES